MNTSFDPIRTVIKPGAPDPQRSPKCEAAGCMRSTKERKPYCTDHVDMHPYVAGLVEALADCDRERAQVARRGAKAVDLAGITTREIMGQLWQYGGRTIERLARDLQLPVEVVASYGEAMAEGGLVRLGSSARNNQVLEPTVRRRQFLATVSAPTEHEFAA